MSEQEKVALKHRFRTAQKLIAEKRYDAARHVLEQIDHPQAEAWLKKIEGKSSRTSTVAPVSGTMIVFGIVAFVVVIGLIIAGLYAPRLVEAIKQNAYNPYLDETYVSNEEILYSNVAGYCYYVTGYGGELCLDWADLLFRDYRDIVNHCFEPVMEIVVLESADYVAIGNCLVENGVPSPL